jgi:secondary thiamine-phosphate synthase enzyme
MLYSISIKTNSREEILDITNKIQEFVSKNNIKDGVIILFVPHTTAAITINEGYDEDVKIDILNHMKKLIPKSPDFRHVEGNSDAHIKSSLFGVSEIIIVNNGKLILGTWQRILFMEFDGPRTRKIYIKVIS